MHLSPVLASVEQQFVVSFSIDAQQICDGIVKIVMCADNTVDDVFVNFPFVGKAAKLDLVVEGARGAGCARKGRNVTAPFQIVGGGFGG